MRITMFMLLVCTTVVYFGCSNHHSNVIGVREGSMVVVDADKVKDTIDIALSRWVDNLEIIQLDDSSIEAFFGYPFITISEHYIGIFDELKPYRLFDRQSGNYKGKVGDIGRGPGEYQNIYSTQIDEAAGRVYMMPWTSNNILTFDLNGRFINPIPLAFMSPKGHFRVDTKNNTVIVGTIPMSIHSVDKIVWKQDLDGNLIGGEDAASFALQNPTYDEEVVRNGNTVDYDFQICSMIPVDKTDYLYHYNIENNTLEPVFKMNVKNKGYIDGVRISVAYTELPDWFIGNVMTSTRTGRSERSVKYQQLVVHKTNLTGAWFRLNNDFLGIENIRLSTTGGYNSGSYFSGGYFIQNFDPLSFIEILRKAKATGNVKVVELIQSQLPSIKEDGNNILVFGKLKQPL